MRTLMLATLVAFWVTPVSACGISVSLGGEMVLSGDAGRIDSTEPGGHGALVSITNLNLSAATITVAPPVLTNYPALFNIGTAVTSVAYAGGGLLSGVSQNFTTAQTSFQVPAVLSVAAVLTVHNRVTNSSGFHSGQYQTRTVLTCS